MHHKMLPSGIWRIGFVRVLLPALMLAGFVTGGRPLMKPVASPDPDLVLSIPVSCPVDIGLPIEIRIQTDEDLRPGARVGARIEVLAHEPVDDVSVTFLPPPGVRIDGPTRTALGSIGRNASKVHPVFLLTPPGRSQKVVGVRVEAVVGDTRFTRGATINLLYDPEPFEIVTDPDGRRVRQVQATSIR